MTSENLAYISQINKINSNLGVCENECGKKVIKCNNKKKIQILKIKYDQFSKKEILFKLTIK